MFYFPVLHTRGVGCYNNEALVTAISQASVGGRRLGAEHKFGNVFHEKLRRPTLTRLLSSCHIHVMTQVTQPSKWGTLGNQALLLCWCECVQKIQHMPPGKSTLKDQWKNVCSLTLSGFWYNKHGQEMHWNIACTFAGLCWSQSQMPIHQKMFQYVSLRD